MNEQEKRAKELFNETIKLAPEDRGAFLDEQCDGDDTLRAEVEDYLTHHYSTVKDPIPQRIPGEYQPGDTIAHFTIRDRLGSGGMGAVYLAEQSVPVKRKVALKVIKPGFDTRPTLARFQAERQALARMDHPCIAKVLEAGATETGRPWFAMEYIKGNDLLSYCDKNKLDTEQRLQLFIKICHAIQHAHQRGIMHRDLKPSNILVVRGENDEPQPKVIDFGIAKAISNDLTDMSLHTAIGQLVGTLPYMSPEQVEGSDDLDTRTDVYSLGVILYELISGKPPFSGQTGSHSSQESMKKAIIEDDPPNPSTQLSSIGDEQASSIAQSRRTNSVSLQNTLRRELELIPLKALRKDRAERYATPDDLAADVQRYLDGDALEAAPITRSYRFRKFVHRNKGPVITAGLFMVVLLAATVITSAFWLQAVQEKRAAENSRDKELEATRIAEDERSKTAEANKLVAITTNEFNLTTESKMKSLQFLNAVFGERRLAKIYADELKGQSHKFKQLNFPDQIALFSQLFYISQTNDHNIHRITASEAHEFYVMAKDKLNNSYRGSDKRATQDELRVRMSRLEIWRAKKNEYAVVHLQNLSDHAAVLQESQQIKGEILLAIGNIYSQINRHKDAVIHYKGACNILELHLNNDEFSKAKYVEAREQLGIAHMNSKDYVSAEFELNEVMLLKSNDGLSDTENGLYQSSTLAHLAVLAVNKGEFDESLMYWDQIQHHIDWFESRSYYESQDERGLIYGDDSLANSIRQMRDEITGISYSSLIPIVNELVFEFDGDHELILAELEISGYTPTELSLLRHILKNR